MAAAVEQPHLDAIAGGPVVDSASITPPQSANGKKDVPEGLPTELSDLELDPKAAQVPDETPVKQEEVEDDDDEDIEPDHYYGGGKIPVFKPVSNTRGLQIDRLGADEQRSDYETVPRLQKIRRESGQIWNAGWNREGGSSKGMVSGWKIRGENAQAHISL